MSDTDLNVFLIVFPPGSAGILPARNIGCTRCSEEIARCRIRAHLEIENTGSKSTTSVKTLIYLSDDPLLGQTDQLIKSIYVKQLPVGSRKHKTMTVRYDP